MPEEMDDFDAGLAGLIEHAETETERYARVGTVVAAAAECGTMWQLAVDLNEGQETIDLWSDAAYAELAKLTYRDLQVALMLQIFATGKPRKDAARTRRMSS